MDGARLSPFPHYSWFARRIAILPPRVLATHEERFVTHRLLLTTAGSAEIAWATAGKEVTFRSAAGDLGFHPRDDATHRRAITATDHYEEYALLLPVNHLHSLAATDGLNFSHGLHALPAFRDPLLHASLLRLAAGGGIRDVSEDIGDEIAARQIVARLCAIQGGRPPEWQRDTSVFVASVMRRIVERVDAHLAVPPSLETVSQGFGLSPSHFARKFRCSTGLSLNRFVNRRRIGLALGLLREADVPLARLSMDLGFCSQSHFTRLFHGLTGITPHHFSRWQRPPEQ